MGYRAIPSWVKVVLGASLLSTALHYTDNYIAIDEYPQPDWIGHQVVYLAWITFTIFGVLGYLAFRQNEVTVAGAFFIAYSYTGLSSLGHYNFGGFSEFTMQMHLTIWMDGITGSAVFLLGVWCLKQARSDGQGSRPVSDGRHS